MAYHVPPPQQQPPRKRKGHPVLFTTGISLGALVVFFAGVVIGSAGSDASNTASSGSAPTATVTRAGPTVTRPGPTLTQPGPTVTTTEAGPAITETKPGPTVTKRVKPKGPSGSIPGDGTFRVGSEVKPGTYKSKPDASGVGMCYWARLRSANEDSIISNHLGSGPTFVTIHSTDKYFQTTGCATWKRV